MNGANLFRDIPFTTGEHINKDQFLITREQHMLKWAWERINVLTSHGEMQAPVAAQPRNLAATSSIAAVAQRVKNRVVAISVVGFDPITLQSATALPVSSPTFASIDPRRPGVRPRWK